MQYMLLIYIDEQQLESLPPGQFEEMMRGCLTHADALKTKGTLIESQMLEPASTARTLRQRGAGRLTTTDGPFAETKEVLGGFNLIEAESMDEAARIAAAFPWSRIGSVEIRPVRDIQSMRARVFSSANAQSTVSAR
jgi:hypothetical protein